MRYVSGMLSRRLIEVVGILLIGDAVMALLKPTRYSLLWAGGPGWWRSLARYFASHREMTRAVAAGELAFGIWLASRQVKVLK